jgi:hypothetical protein
MPSPREIIGPIDGPELEYFVLRRLERFAARLVDPQVLAIPAWHRLAQRATAVAFQDCVSLGLIDEADVIIADAWSALPLRP